MSRFSERDWHSLLITVSAYESHYAYAWLLLHRGTDGDNKPISAASLAERILTERQTCVFFICLNPPTAGSQQPPGALSPLVFFFLTLFTHISVEVYYGRAVYTNKSTVLFSLSCAPYFSVSLLTLCL